MKKLPREPHRPSLLAAPDQPWKIDPRVACQIRCTAAGMVGKTGLTHQDRDDLEQELAADLLSRISRFDAGRAGRATFVTRLLNHAAASILAARKAEKRDWRATVRSLDEVVEAEEGVSLQLTDLLDQEGLARDGGRAAQAQREHLELRIDLERVMATLSDRERRVCALLMQENSRQAAQRLGIPRATFYDLIRKLRRRFELAGLKKYL